MMTSKVDSGKPIVIWHEFDGPGDTSIEVLEEICELYTERYGVKVIPEVMSIHDLGRRLVDIANTGAGPHIAFVPADMLVFAEQAKYAEVPAEPFLDLVGQDSLASMTMNGKQLGIPILTGNHLVLYSNKDIYPVPPASWEEIARTASMLLDKGITPIGADLKQSYWFVPLLSAFGGWPMRDGKPHLDNEEMKQALAFVSDAFEQGIVASLDGSTALLDDFINGKLGAILCGEWIYTHLSRNLQDKLTVSKLPDIGGNPSISMTSSIGFVYPNGSLDSDAREQILSFTSFMLSEECQLKWVNRVQRIPANTRVQQDLLTKSSPNTQAILSLLPTSRPMPIHPAIITTWKAMSAGIEILQEQGPEEAFRRMELTANSDTPLIGTEDVQ
ncbi:extracellular solute-binding protein [Paenibacillus sp. SI8]|uniref:sugar ABC transporter substrate-binding protein n=1 Tax=unclassified Paenibacillus TaxID=185978 RepID=UPI0034672CA4